MHYLSSYIHYFFLLFFFVAFSQHKDFSKIKDIDSYNNFYKSPLKKIVLKEETTTLEVTLLFSPYNNEKELSVYLLTVKDILYRKYKKGIIKKLFWDTLYVGRVNNYIDIKIDSLENNTKYIAKVLIKDGNKYQYISRNYGIKTKRCFSWFSLGLILGALALFIYGMKQLSNSLQQVSGDKLRLWLGKMTSNSFKGVLTGFGITSIVQSSSVTTIMIVSFVNAGLLTLKQAIGVLMGANIGTTLTAWIILLIGFKVHVTEYLLVLLGVTFPLLFSNNKKITPFINSLYGFTILFLGLEMLKGSVPKVEENSMLVQFFLDYKDMGLYGILLFILLGTIITIVIQSSSAAMTLTMSLVAKGIIPFEIAIAMVLGENIGTTITAEIAAIVGNTNAKRAARVHSLFNIIGVIWIVGLLPYIEGVIKKLVLYLNGETVFLDKQMANEGIAIFHTFFNISNVLLLIWFVPFLNKIVKRIIKSKEGEEKINNLLSINLVGDVAIEQCREIVISALSKISKMSDDCIQILFLKKNKLMYYKRIDNIEKELDMYRLEFTKNVGNLIQSGVSADGVNELRYYNFLIIELETISDMYYVVTKELIKKDKLKLFFTPEHRDSLNELLLLINQLFLIAQNCFIEQVVSFDSEFIKKKIEEVKLKINTKIENMESKYLEFSENIVYNTKIAMIYRDIYKTCEHLGHHIENIGVRIIFYGKK